MLAAYLRREPVLGLERDCRRRQVDDGEQDVVELQLCEEAAPALIASSEAWKRVLSIFPW